MRVLLIEDNPGDALLVQSYLDELEHDIELDHVTRLSEARARLETTIYDAVLLDLSLPDAHGLETVQQVMTMVPRVPIVVMSGLGDHTVAIAAVQTGAQDYLVKGEAQGSTILRTLRYSVERARLNRELEEAQRRAQLLAALGEALQTAHSPMDVFKLTSNRIGEALGAQGMALWYRPAEKLELRWTWGSGAHALDERLEQQVHRALEDNQPWYDEPRNQCAVEPVPDATGNALAALLVIRDGGKIWLESERDLLQRAAATMGLALERADLIARLEVNNADLEVKTSLALEAAKLVSFDWNIASDRLTLSPNATQVLGSGAGNAFASSVGHAFIHPDDLEDHRSIVKKARESGLSYRSTYRLWHEERREYLWIEEYGVVRVTQANESPSIERRRAGHPPRPQTRRGATATKSATPRVGAAKRGHGNLGLAT
ncbi:MAG: response regulator [Pleurocapsa sp. SU_196_0]|nr:response regulator [Pleurocapsa sp. SU_196_0]